MSVAMHAYMVSVYVCML